MVPAGWLMELYDKTYGNQYNSLDEFLDVYEPETDGDFIYQQAVKDDVLIEDFGIVMNCKEE